jgi:thiopurine S-methyltransferase
MINMDSNFWREKWKNNEIAFHRSEANPLLVAHFDKLSLAKGSRVFVPLCGKTLDIPWLLSEGYRVAGAELSSKAIEQLFAELGLEPEVSDAGELVRYSAKNIDIFADDIFSLSGKLLGLVDAVYDRAALVALPEEMRNRYAAHLMEISNKAPQLLICYEYDQRLMEGPPFSITEEEVNWHYSNSYTITQTAHTDVPGGLKGLSAVKENVWLLNNELQTLDV